MSRCSLTEADFRALCKDLRRVTGKVCIPLMPVKGKHKRKEKWEGGAS